MSAVESEQRGEGGVVCYIHGVKFDLETVSG